MDHLFRPFSQEDLNIGRNFEGNGLGLALAKRYLEKMGGSLLVDSIKGVGTTFTFTLPVAQDTRNIKKDPETQVKVKTEKILMIDNSLESYELLGAFLKNNYAITVFNSKDFKTEILNTADFRFIILDVNPTNWDECISLCSEIKKQDRFNRPLLIISSEFQENRIIKFYEAGAAKFLIKPFSKNDLLNALKEIKNQNE
jgi:PleD family two-component response regulator